MIAKLVEDNLDEFMGHAALYSVDPPMVSNFKKKSYSYVVVSHLAALETVIFGSNESGMTDACLFTWQEPWVDHEEALKRAGYTIEE